MRPIKTILLEHFIVYLVLGAVILVLTLNAALVTAVQVAVDFPLDSPTAGIPQDEGWEILDAHGTDRTYATIYWQDHQHWRLVITERHFHANRWRTVCDTFLTEQNFDEEFSNSYGRIRIKLHGYADIEHFSWISSPVYRTLCIPADFLLWNVGLLIFEIAGWLLLRKLRGK